MIIITLCIPTSSLLLTWVEKYDTMWKYLIAYFLNTLKTNENLYFITLNYTPAYTLHPKLWISIQINNKLNLNVQSVTMVIIWG